MLRKKYLFPVIAMLLILSMALFVGCGTKEEAKNEDTKAAESTKVDELKEVLKVADAFFASDKVKTPTIAADEVNTLVQANDANTYVLSIRKPDHYALGHIKGAVNIPFANIYKAENLATLPKDKKIIVVCYTGHTASQASMLLNLLGYNAVPVKFGMMGWTNDDKVLAIPRFTAPTANLPTVTTATEAQSTNELPTIETGKTTANEIINALAEKNLPTKLATPTIAPQDVLTAVQNKDASKLVVDIRKAEHYAAGHIEGAINIPFAQVSKEENLKKLPKDKQIVVVCYTGHTASYTTMFYNLLGYNAVALKFGMSSWTTDLTVLGLPATMDGKGKGFATVTN